MLITAFYASLLAFLYLYLTAKVISQRYSKKIGMGHNNDPVLQARIRAHGNFIEYVPFGLFLMGLTEWNGVQIPVMHVLGCMLLAGRVSHMFSLIGPFAAGPHRVKLRSAGMVLTILMIAACALVLLSRSVTAFFF